MTGLFVVIRRRGPAWNDAVVMDEQAGWAEHARFMDDLVEQGVVLAGGPLEDTNEILLVMRTADEPEIHDHLVDDNWHVLGMLETVSVAPWHLRLGKID